MLILRIKTRWPRQWRQEANDLNSSGFSKGKSFSPAAPDGDLPLFETGRNTYMF